MEHIFDRYLVSADAAYLVGTVLVCVACLEQDGIEFVRHWDEYLDGTPSLADLTCAALAHEVEIHHDGSPV